MELCIAYATLDEYVNESFADTASRTYLEKRAAERGIYPKKASSAILKMVVTPADININMGEKFTYKDLFFSVIEKTDLGVYKIKSDMPGETGNIQSGDLFPVNFFQDFIKAEIKGIIAHGTDEEETEHFRKRYFDNLNYLSFGGNIADYKEKVNAIEGVGGVKVIPHWNGSGTVKLIIIDDKYSIPSASLIKKVKNTFDPDDFSGNGDGIAPIGHCVTVEACKALPISINFSISFEPDIDFTSVKNEIKNIISSYFWELSAHWEEKDSLIVRISQIEAKILNLKGIIDIQNTTLNGKADNLTLDFAEIPIIREISYGKK